MKTHVQLGTGSQHVSDPWKEKTMRESLTLKTLWTARLCNATLLGAVLALIALLPALANAQGGPPEKVTICHKPGTPEQKTMTLPTPAANAHQGHGDTLGPCEDVEEVCGDGICGAGEDEFNCAVDCGCAAPGQTCNFSDAAPGGCFCDEECIEFEDCCPDACAVCGQCAPPQ